MVDSIQRYTQPCLQINHEEEFFRPIEVPLFPDPNGKYALASDVEDVVAINKTLHASVNRLTAECEQRVAELAEYSDEYNSIKSEYQAMKNHADKLAEVLCLAETWVDKTSPTKKFIENAVTAYRNRSWK